MGLQQKGIEILIKAKDEASGIFDSLKGKVAVVGAAIAAYFGVNAFIGAIKGAGELEAKLSEVKAVSGATAAEMVELRKAAEDAGKTTQYSAVQAADALGNLTRAGVSAKDSVAALPGVLSLAQAGGLDLAHASEIVTKVVAGMGLAFTDTGRVADVLAMGANASNTSVKGLAEALSYAAPVARSVGLSLEATVAIIGKFADSGIDASRAGTALNAVLSQFSDPSSKFRQELALAGITTRDFEKAIHQLAEAGPAGQKAILAVGTEAGPALRALLNQGMPALDELKGKLKDATGSAAATAAVMADNLPGAMAQLGTAWDSVKNALATPVLPVLKDGVGQLTSVLRDAVNNGTIGRFGDAIATGFQSGLKWAREFINQIDVEALKAKLDSWAQRADETFTKVGEYATNTGNIVKLVYGVMSAGVNTVLGAFYKLAEGAAFVNSKIAGGLANLQELISKVTFGSISARYKESAEEMRIAAGASMAVSEAFAKKASEAFDAAANGAEVANKGWAGLTTTMSTTDGQARTSAQVIKAVATALDGVGSAADLAGDKMKAGAAAQRAAAEQASASVAKLRTEYEAALAAGNVQLAVEKLNAMSKALQSTADSAKTAEEKLKDVQEAFTRLGIASTADLNKARDAALRDFEIIKGSGLATANDLRNAFAVYANAAIAANGGVATEAVKAKASMYGLAVETDETGKSIVKDMSAASAATKRLGSDVDATAGKFDRMATSARNAAAAASSPGKIDGSGMAAFNDSLKKNPSGVGAPVDNSYIFNLWARYQRGEVGPDDLAAAQNALQVQKNNTRVGGPGSVSLSGRQDDQVWLGRLQQIVDSIENYKADVGVGFGRSSGSGTSSGATGIAPQVEAAPSSSGSMTVNLNLPGVGGTSVSVSSAADAQRLASFLSTLQAELQRASA